MKSLIVSVAVFICLLCLFYLFNRILFIHNDSTLKDRIQADKTTNSLISRQKTEPGGTILINQMTTGSNFAEEKFFTIKEKATKTGNEQKTSLQKEETTSEERLAPIAVSVVTQKEAEILNAEAMEYVKSKERTLMNYIKIRSGMPHVICDIKNGTGIYITIFGHRAFSKSISLINVGDYPCKQNTLHGSYTSYIPGLLGVSASYDCVGYASAPGFLILDTFCYDQNPEVSTEQIKEGFTLLTNRIPAERDFMLILSPGERFFEIYNSETFKQKVLLYEKCADQLGIPTINLCDYIYNEVLEGNINKEDIEDDFFVNGQGTASDLFQMYAEELLLRLMNEIIDDNTSIQQIQMIEKKRKALIDSKTINKRVSYEQEEYPNGWLPWQLSEINSIEHCLNGTGSAPYSFEFYGTIFGLSGMSTGECGDILFSIDGGEWEKQIINTPKNGISTYEYLLASHLKEDKAHSIQIKPFDPHKQVKIDHFFVTSIKNINSNDSLDGINSIYRKIPALSYKPPQSILSSLPKTKAKLEQGKSLSILLLGDSIMSGIASSNFQFLLEKHYPKCKVKVLTSLRGSTGCWYYKEPDHFQEYVGKKDFDLIIIGGISHKKDIDAIKDVVDQVKEKKPNAEIILMTDAWGMDLNFEDLNFDSPAAKDDTSYQGMLLNLALSYQKDVAFMDITFPWAAYLRKCKTANVPYTVFKSDAVHANQYGNQILARIIEAYFAPDGDDPCVEWIHQE